MATVHFTSHLRAHVASPSVKVDGATVRAALDAALADNATLRGYVLDDQNRLRRHVMVFVDGRILEDRVEMAEPVNAESEIYVMQALSGG